jgi:RNA polymerase sigma factor (sigma-70 family)
MSRRKIRPDEVRNKEHYCKKYVAMEVKHENIQMGVHVDNEVSYEQYFSDDAPNTENTVNAYGDMDELAACEKEGFGWIDYLDSPALFKAVNALSERQKKILTMCAMQMMTTREIAAEMGVSQQAISKCIDLIRKKIKKVLI